MSTEKMREDFEREWNKVSGRTPERSIAMDGQNSYENRIDDAAWWAWQASRAVIEVELNAWGCDEGFDVVDESDIRHKLESLGLKVKP